MISGVINVNKEAGFTSHDVVAKLRGILHQRKIGHTGTLDPDAVGVLPVCLGKATKLVETLAAGTKTYETVLLLGRETDTQDISGETVAEKPVTCSVKEIRTCLAGFLGEQEQIPPMYSAKKQNGKRLYQLAREGVVVERQPSRIRIDELEMLSCELPRVSMRITCSKGTYIRTLCHDIGQKLGCGGCMEQLIRTRVGEFTIENAVTLDEIRARTEAGQLADILMAPDTFFSELPAVKAAPGADRLLHNGNPLSCDSVRIFEISMNQSCSTYTDMKIAESQENGPRSEPEMSRIRVYDSGGTFMGVYTLKAADGAYYPELFFYEAQE